MSLWENLSLAATGLSNAAKDVLTEQADEVDNGQAPPLAASSSVHDGHGDELVQLREETDQLREALDATEALCERQREEIRRLKSGGGAVRDDNDEARREAELMMLKNRLRSLEQENDQLRLTEAKHGAAERELRALKEARAVSEARASQAERDAARLEQECKQLRAQRAELERRAADAEAAHHKAVEAERERAAANKDAEAAHHRALEAERERAAADKEAALEDVRVANAALIEEHQQLLLRLSAQRVEPQPQPQLEGSGALDAVRAELAAAKAANEQHRAQTAAHAARVADELQGLRAEHEALRGQNAALRDAAAAAQALQMQVASLSQQLVAERDSTAEERREEVATLKRTMDRIRALEEAVHGAKEKEDLLKTHLLEREEELEALMAESAALKVELGRANAALSEVRERAARCDDVEVQLEATERALRNLDEAVGAMTEEHKLECQRRERAVRERVVDEWKARLDKREADWGGEMAALRARMDALQMELEREQAVSREWASKCADINREVEPLREAFAECMRKLTEAVDKDAYAVDKRLVANLLCSYFTLSDSGKRNEVLCLTLRILDVPRERRNDIYRRNAGWLSVFSEETADAGRSMSDMWTEFLLRESSERREDADAAAAGAAAINNNNHQVGPPPPPPPSPGGGTV